MLRAHSPLCRARPVSRRRCVLLVRVALGGFLGSWVRWVRFLLTFRRLCACSEAVREEILWAGGRRRTGLSLSFNLESKVWGQAGEGEACWSCSEGKSG